MDKSPRLDEGKNTNPIKTFTKHKAYEYRPNECWYGDIGNRTQLSWMLTSVLTSNRNHVIPKFGIVYWIIGFVTSAIHSTDIPRYSVRFGLPRFLCFFLRISDKNEQFQISRR